VLFEPGVLRPYRTGRYGGHVSSKVAATVPGGRPEAIRRPRQEETFRKLVSAALDTLRGSSYADLTVRGVAARAQVAPATAYTYFSSKNHLVAEVYLELVREVPYFTDVNDTRLNRVQQALRSLALVVADEPEVAAACTTALLSNDNAVRPVRDRIGAEIHKRIKSALGPSALGPSALGPQGDARTVAALEMSYFGALVHAGSGAFTYRQIADRLGYVVGLILGGDDG
jgi:AcrR family transcriptional regulator